MIVRKYIYNGTEHRSVRAVLKAVFDDQHVVFSRPQTAEDWARHGVTFLEEVVPPAPETDEEKQQRFAALVQAYLDGKAMELNYDSCLSVCSYVDTGVRKFDEEGAAFRAWRSAVWAKCYEILDQVKAGTRPEPSPAELIAELPELVISYAEV